MGGSVPGFGGGGKGAPAPPDFTAAAEAQAKSGHVNQTNPFGSTGWRQDPTTGLWSQSTSLAPAIQGSIGNLENQIAAQGPLPTGDQVRQQAIDAGYQQATSRLDPQWQQADTAFRSQMANQGLTPGGEAYDAAKGNFDRAKSDAYASALRGATTNANQAQALTFGENQSAQMQPYQQLGSLGSLMAGLSGSGTQTQYLPAAAAAYQGAQNQYATQQAGKNSMMGGGANLATLALLAG